MDGSIYEDKLVRSSVTLVIGDMLEWQAAGRLPPEIDGFHFADIGDIAPSFMRRLDPDIVLSSLVARKFDAIEIARKLGQMEYRGSYRILVNDIPNPDLVLQEVFNVAPYLDCDIIDFAAVFPSN